MAASILTQKILKELFNYDPEAGIFTRARNVGRRVKAGDVLQSMDCEGYLRVGIGRKGYKLHRLAWLYVYGYLPEMDVDHINGVKHDNRIANLRLATLSENMQNRKTAQVNNASGYLGVHWHKRTSKFRANIQYNGKVKYIGRFDTAEEASVAYIAAKRQLHPYSTL